MPPSICARMLSGLIGTPQSTAQTTLCTLTPPSPTLTSATCATIGAEALGHRDAAHAALGRRRAPAGLLGGEPQHAGVARRVRRAAPAGSRADPRPPPRRARRGRSRPRRRCGSSRPSATRAPARRRRSSSARPCGSGWHRAGAARPRPRSRRRRPSIIASNGPPAMIDWPTMWCSQATMLAVGVEPGLQRVHVGRPVAPALHVVLAGPLHLDRRAPVRARAPPPPPRRSRRRRRPRAGRSRRRSSSRAAAPCPA